jgi:hypothetical protein
MLPFAALGASIAMAIEEPKYQVLETTGDYEIRRYEPFIVAETEVPGEFDAAGNSAFRILAGYIFGDNRVALSSAQDSRASESADHVKMAMTAPVFSTSPSASEDLMNVYAFVMPAEYDLESLPIPLDSRVKIREMSAKVFAVRRYSGRWTSKGFNANEAALRDSLQRAGFKPVGNPLFARYNAPFTPWFMRRNEVLIELSAERLSGP